MVKRQKMAADINRGDLLGMRNKSKTIDLASMSTWGCQEPLNPKDLMNMLNDYAPTLLMKMTLDEAHSIEPELQPTLGGILACHGHGIFAKPEVAQMSQTDLPQLFPQAQISDGPVVMLCLPDSMKDALDALSNSALITMNITSSNLLEKSTFLVLSGGAHEIRLDTWLLSDTMRDIGDDGFHLILVCDGQLRVVVHPWDEHCGVAMQCAMMTSGMNYRPHRNWAYDAIAEAVNARAPEAWETEARYVWCPEVLTMARDKR